MSGGLLNMQDLRIHFGPADHPARAVDGVDLVIHEHETVALVGESGSGKSLTALAAANLLPRPAARVAGGEIRFAGTDVLRAGSKQLRRLRGGDIAYIFQDPTTALNPVMRVGDQVRETLAIHRPDIDGRKEVLDLFTRVGIDDPSRRMNMFPHEFSGGMQQRVMIAMALACRPRLLIADEPTTALDVTIQKSIFELLRDVRETYRMSLLLITHNLGLVSGFAVRIYVMYAGRMVEEGPVSDVLSRPAHPYTRALLDAVPSLDPHRSRRRGIPGRIPDPREIPPGCRFHPRCPIARERCRTDDPRLMAAGHERQSACFFYEDVLRT